MIIIKNIQYLALSKDKYILEYRKVIKMGQKSMIVILYACSKVLM
jgi:hypothetical protein